MYHRTEEGARFDSALRSALEDPEVPEPVRRALKSVWLAREERCSPVEALERRLWSALPSVRAGRANEHAMIELANRITVKAG